MNESYICAVAPTTDSRRPLPLHSSISAAVTYANACVCRSQGVSIRHDGDCAAGDGPFEGEPMGPASTPPQGQEEDDGAQACGGLMGTGCPEGHACIYAVEAQCGAADQMGVCLRTPTFCTLNYQPVCGCDGASSCRMESCVWTR